MFARHPLEHRESKISSSRVAEALRLSMMAELDAINMYLQFAESIEDERFKKLFADVAREEKTHLGEFLAALRLIDEEQARELEEGLREASEIMGVKSGGDGSMTEARREENVTPESLGVELESRIRDTLDKMRVFRRHLHVLRVPAGVLALPRSSASRELEPLTEISVKFRIEKRALDASRIAGSTLLLDEAVNAASELARNENRLIITCLREQAGIKTTRGAWDTPGEALTAIASALAELYKNGAMPPFILILSPATYSKLLAVYDKTGVMEIERVKALVGDVVVSPEIEDDVVIASVNPASLDLVVGADGEIEFLGPEDGYYAYRIRETLALRVKNSKAIALLEMKRG